MLVAPMSANKQEARGATRTELRSPWPHVRLAETDRLETFSDSVLSITITLLVAEIVQPEHAPGQLLDKLTDRTMGELHRVPCVVLLCRRYLAQSSGGGLLGELRGLGIDPSAFSARIAVLEAEPLVSSPTACSSI